jgi:hypothetical protein
MKTKKNTFSTLVLELFFPSIANCKKLKIRKIQKSTSPIGQVFEYCDLIDMKSKAIWIKFFFFLISFHIELFIIGVRFWVHFSPRLLAEQCALLVVLPRGRCSPRNAISAAAAALW